MRLLNELEGYVSSQFSAIKTALTMTKLEAKLAGLSLYPLLVNVCFLLVCLTSTWATLMVALGYALFYFFGSLTLAFSGVFLLNIITAMLLLKYMRFNLKQMSFQKTRAYLSSNSGHTME